MKHVVVVGGGVVGLTTAWSLADAGFAVSLVERGTALATGASFANGGQLSYRYVSPLADAGIPLKALRWLFAADSPQQFRPQADPQQWRWMACFLAHCTSAANRRTTERLLRLGSLSQSAFADIARHVPADAIALRRPGKLVVYRNRREFARAAAGARATAETAPGEVRVLDADACVACEPALADARALLAGGIFTASEEVADCHAFCLQLAERLAEREGVEVLTGIDVAGFVLRDGRIHAVTTSAGEIGTDAVVIAAGLGSVGLAASAGLRLPIYPVKGYSLTAPVGPGHFAPAVSVTDFERKVLYARIGDDLRVAAMADLVGNDEGIDPKRIAALQRIVRATLPRAADYDRAVPWAGLRPATPGGAPIIGRTPVQGLWLNVGHGPLGFTLAAGTARIVAALIAGRGSPIPLDGMMHT